MVFQKKWLPSLITLVLLSASAEAQEATSLKKITVSANKMNEDLQKSSTSVTVITAQEIEEEGIESLSDLTKLLPNTSEGSYYSGTSDWNYRGLNSSVFKSNNPVIIYVDGVPQTSRRTLYVNMKNVEKIEVVQGPSGTVHGRGSIGGVINIVTKKAEPEFTGDVAAEIGNNGTYNFDLAAGGPLIDDTLLGKLTVSKHIYGGYLKYADSDVSKRNDDYLSTFDYSGELVYFPNDDSSLTFQLWHNEMEAGYGNNELVKESDLNSGKRPDEVDYNTKNDQDKRTDSQSLHYEYDFRSVRLEAQVTHRKTENRGRYDCDFGSSANIICTGDNNVEDYDGEIRLVSDESDFKWVTGLYYGTNETTSIDDGYYLGTTPMSVSEGTQNEDTRAVFGQFTYPLIKQLELTAGARAQSQTVKVDSTYYDMSMGTTPVKGSKDETAFLPKLGLAYIVNDNNTLFVNYAKGYLAGGYNSFQTVVNGADDAYFKPETNHSYELGYKGSFSDLTLAATLFYMDIEDIHTYTFISGFYSAGNLKGAISQGFEVQLAYDLTPTWALDTSFGYTDAKYKSGSYFNGQDASDNTVEKTPDMTGLLGIKYHDKQWMARLEAQYRGDYYYDFQNTEKVDGFTVFNARVIYQLQDWELSGYIDNITDQTGVLAVMDAASLSGAGTLVRSLNKPRTFGAGVTYRF